MKKPLAECDVFDHAGARAALGDDDELLAEMAELYLSDLPGLLDQVEAAIESRDGDAIRRSAHQLKGASSNFHARSTVEAAYRVERMGRDGDLEGVESAFAALRSEIDRLRPELEKLVAS